MSSADGNLDLCTFSIAAYDPLSGMFGICVSTKVPAVGAICPYARCGVGAIVTQARKPALRHRRPRPAGEEPRCRGDHPDAAAPGQRA